VALTGCSAPEPEWQAGPTASASPSIVESPSPEPAPSLSPSPAQAGLKAPTSTFALGLRNLTLHRGDRTLVTTIWYPAIGEAGRSARTDAPVAPGQFPVLLFSHGLNGMPSHQAPIHTRLAAAGFVVIAPAYPYTKQGASPFNAGDVGNQPADALYVLNSVLQLDSQRADPFSGHLLGDRAGAYGYSAGGFTTAGMLTGARDATVKAAVVIAGGSMGRFSGPSTPVLFVHGDQDQVVGYQSGRNAYTSVSWPKAFLTQVGADHSSYFSTSSKGFTPMVATMRDFFRWSLYGDPSAKDRLATVAGSAVTSYESRL
jgi:dienelactone hydrolase